MCKSGAKPDTDERPERQRKRATMFCHLEVLCYYSLELYPDRYKFYSPSHDPYDATSNRGQSRGHG